MFHNKSWLLWWPVSLSIGIQSTLNHIRLFFTTTSKITTEIFKICWQLITPTPTWKCTCCIMQMLLVRVRFSFKKLLQIVVKFNLSLFIGISVITWVIILKQLFASGSWILVNIHLDFVSGNIHQHSLRFRRMIVKYEKISRWLSRRNARVSRNKGKIAPSRACPWFENTRFDCMAISEFLWSLTNQNAWFVSSFCTELTLFCTVFKKKLPCS